MLLPFNFLKKFLYFQKVRAKNGNMIQLMVNEQTSWHLKKSGYNASAAHKCTNGPC